MSKPKQTIERMRNHANVADVQAQGCEALRSLAMYDATRVTIRELGGIDAIVKAMRNHANVAEVQAHGCKALWNLAMNDDNKVTIRELGGIDVIVQAMRKHANVADVQRYGCGALRNLAMNDANKVTIRELGGINVIVQAMRKHANVANVQRYGCGALRNLAMNDANRVTICELGGINDILKAMKNHEHVADFQRYGCAALWNLTINDANKVAIRELGGIQAIVKAMKNHEHVADVQRYGCAALWNLTINDANNVAIRQLGGIQAIVKAMKNHEHVADVQRYGCGALCDLASNDANRVTVSAQGGIEVILQAMKNHANVADIQAQGCAVLRNLGQTEEDRIIKTIDTLLTFKIVFTYLTYQYKNNNLSSFNEYKEYIFKALDHTASTCISTQHNELGPFVNCLNYALEKNLIVNNQFENLKGKATNCDLHQEIDKVHQRIDNLNKQLNSTQSCLIKMQDQYKTNLRIRSGISFTKVIVNIFTLGLGGNFAEAIINCGIDNVIDFGNFEHVQSVIESNDSESPALEHFNKGLEYAEEHFHDNLDNSIAEILDEFKRNANGVKHSNEERLCSELGCFLKVSQMQSEAKDPRVSKRVADYSVLLWLLVILYICKLSSQA